MATLSSILPPVSVSTASGTLPAGNGGTGLTSPGTSGNVLTSDGTGWTSSAVVTAYPQNIQSGNYTLVLGDAGKHIYSVNTGAQTITIPANASVAFPIGTLITIVNQGTTSILLSGAGVSVFPAGSTTAVTSPVVPAGSTGQLVKVDTNSWEAIIGVVQANLVNYVVVGGGSDGQGYNGGGGGGVVTGASNFDLGVLTVTVGAQGSGGNAGANSSLSGSTTILARSASATRSNASIPEGLFNTYYDGSSYLSSGGGGGGAGGAGGNGSGGNGVGQGGIGLLSTITGTPVYYGAGGNGGYYNDPSTFLAGSPGSGSVVVISVPLSEYSGTRTGSPAVTRAGNNAVLRFTSSGTYTAAVGGGIFYSADMLVIAGGGGGGSSGGGGGAGGYLPSTQTLFRGITYAVTVGAGGSVPFNSSFPAGTGTNSTVAALSLTALGGGGGGSSGFAAGQQGGSGGGSTLAGGGGTVAGGAATQPTSASGGFGNAGGTSSGAFSASGGGGAGGAGASSAAGGAGGIGLASSITGTSVTRAVGGSRTGSAGTANTGNGGAGGSTTGGSGVVIISVPTAFYTGTTTGSPVVTTSGSNTILQFNSSGSYTA